VNRIAIGRRTSYQFKRDPTRHAWAVLHDDRLTEKFCHAISDRTRELVGRTASGKAYDHLDRLVGWILGRGA
jgi:hypothetical protein